MKKSLSIVFVDVLGLPYDGDTLNHRGLGGSESAVIYQSRELVRLGFDVTVYNDCDTDDTQPGVYQGVTHRPLSQIPHDEKSYDIMISSRSVAPFAPAEMLSRFRSFVQLPDCGGLMSRCQYRVLWMHDTFCDGDDLIESFCVNGRIHRIFTLSDWHSTYVMNCNHGNPRNYEVLKPYVWQTRNGIHPYLDWVDIRAKNPHRFVFNSSVTKGMVPLVREIWPQVKQRLPQAQLTVIGGYYKFANDHGPDEQQKTFISMHDDSEWNQRYDIQFTGIITQAQVAQVVANSSYMIYPALFPETFGISALEALAYNTPLITNRFGALENIAFDDACYKINYAIGPNGLFPNIDHADQVKRFVDQVVSAVNTPYVHQQKQYACNRVRDICTWHTVAQQWRQHFYGHFEIPLPVDQYREVTRINHRVSEVFGIRNQDRRQLMAPRGPERRIQVIVPLYNAQNYVERCVASIASQDYHNYQVHFINDASTDQSAQALDQALTEHAGIPQHTITHNTQNQGAVKNQVTAIRQHAQPDDIIMLIDGDDWLAADNQIFQRINNLYQQGAQFTYGSCWSLADSIPLIAQEYPPEVRQERRYREYRFNWNMPYTHLRTFLAQNILNAPDQMFQDSQGEWLKAGGDTSVFYTALEAAHPDRVVCVPDVLYVYNDLNPINDYKIHGEIQTRNAEQVLKQTMSKADIKLTQGYQVVTDATGREWVWLEHDQSFDLIANDWPGLLDTILRNVKDFSVCVQAGGNQGMYPALLSEHFEQVYTFEPNHYNYRSLLHNVDLDRVTPAQCALGAYPGMVRSEFVNGNNAGTAVVTLTDQGDVPMVTIDSLELPSCGLIQLDLEGYEMRAIMGAVRTIEQFHPVIIAEGPERSNDTITGILEQMGYELVDMTGANNDAVYVYTGRPAPFRDSDLPYVPQQKKPLKKILIAIPTAKHIEVDTFKAIYDLELPEGYVADFQYFYGYRIDQIRNLIADWMVKGEWDYLFSVDSDIAFPPHTLKRLISHNRDMVTGVYRQRKPDQHIIEVYTGTGHNVPWSALQEAGDLVEVGGCGFGCVLVKRHVFQNVPYPHFEYHVALDHQNTVSEDVDFCRKVTDRGMTIWCDTTIQCDHIGHYNFRV